MLLSVKQTGTSEFCPGGPMIPVWTEKHQCRECGKVREFSYETDWPPEFIYRRANERARGGSLCVDCLHKAQGLPPLAECLGPVQLPLL